MVTYVQKGESLDYIPESAVAAGEVVMLGTLAGVTKLPIAAGQLGAVAVTGVFEFPKAVASTPISAGAKVYYNTSGATATSGAGLNAVGIAVAAAGSDAATVKVLLNA